MAIYRRCRLTVVHYQGDGDRAGPADAARGADRHGAAGGGCGSRGRGGEEGRHVAALEEVQRRRRRAHRVLPGTD